MGQGRRAALPCTVADCAPTCPPSLAAGGRAGRRVRGSSGINPRSDAATLSGAVAQRRVIANMGSSSSAPRRGEARWPSVAAFSTFFYPLLKENGCEVRGGPSARRCGSAIGAPGLPPGASLTANAAHFRWTSSRDVLLFPIHLGMHWCLVVADFRASGYDSSAARGRTSLNVLAQVSGRRRVCVAHAQTPSHGGHGAADAVPRAGAHGQKGRALSLDSAGRGTATRRDPHQLNGSDCGVFVPLRQCVSRAAAASTASQRDVPAYRRRMVMQITALRC